MKRRLDELARIIAREQLADGSFETLSVAAGAAFGVRAKRYRTTFATSVILGAIAGVDDPELAVVLEPVRQRACDFLIAQAGQDWSFNYWARDEPEAKVRPYPDDWDDTSLALAAIGQVRTEALTGDVLARVVTLMTHCEVQEGGPYRTWIIGQDAEEVWQDVDPAVNSNMAYFLKLQGVELPNLAALADERIATGNLRSPYYPSELPVIYFLSRWHTGAQRDRLLNILTAARATDEHWSNPLETALAITAGLNLHVPVAELTKAEHWLLTRPLSKLDRPYPFCNDPAASGKQYVAGAKALTAALVLEALTKYGEATAPHTAAATDESSNEWASIHEQVVQRVADVYDRLPQLSTAWSHMRERVLTNDPARQITLLPYLFRQSLGDAGRVISDERVTELGAASLFGWLAYTVYDDFLDDEGKPSLLPLANVAMREMVLTYGSGSGKVATRALMDRMESANAWELAHTRFGAQRELLRLPAPDFGDLSMLADRSLGHALGCCLILVELGYSAGSDQVQGLMQFFRHFLIARQLSDDAHDWKADLRLGQVNSVAAMLLSEVPSRGKTVTVCYQRLQQRFSEHTILRVCDLIDLELEAAREALASMQIVELPELLDQLLVPVAASSSQARTKQRETLEFLQSYETAS